MEDYLEMIYRLRAAGETVRIGLLSESLHVKPSSASKMVTNLRAKGLVDFERYGIITLTEKGINLGVYLVKRHEIIHRFLCCLNQSEEELEQTEKIEHFLDLRTVRSMERQLRDNCFEKKKENDGEAT